MGWAQRPQAFDFKELIKVHINRSDGCPCCSNYSVRFDLILFYSIAIVTVNVREVLDLLRITISLAFHLILENEPLQEYLK
jgi:hypothetical protein